MASLLVKVKSRLFIRSSRAAFHQLDGQFSSIARGRGTDFDDLREYAPGDDVRDIDWNATARSSTTLTRRFHTERRHVVTFLVDTGQTMTAVTRDGDVKSDVSIAVVGTMAYLTIRHGDDVGALFGDAANVERVPAGQTEAHLERILRGVQHAASIGDGGGIDRLLAVAARVLRQRMIVVCVTDEVVATPELIESLRGLRARHELIWLTVGDDELAWPDARHRPPIVDVGERWLLPAFVQSKPRVRADAVRSREANRALTAAALGGLGISHAIVHSVDAVVPTLIRLMSTSGHARG